MQWMMALTLAVLGGTGLLHTGNAQETGRTIEIHARRFSFEPAEITLQKGETVTLKLVSEDVAHSLVIKELGVNREVSKGHDQEVTVTPDKVGDFQGKCGRFCGSGHGSMKLTVHVKE
ncbi:cupredoxin domain-containing protein [Edaphobacter aggregans]|uniref:cupredoxin domain-containing protein n=1 Tax=Edaphobacter aggregans TaxID=570835 RepID=UPI0005586476|nr:cupredoxin domain-containing protein [Edaphobacter aggregans]